MQSFLRDIGVLVREFQKAAIAFQHVGILCCDAFFSLDCVQGRELDGELKTAGVLLCDRGNIMKATVATILAKSQQDKSAGLPHERSVTIADLLPPLLSTTFNT